ncbi:MAG: DUF4252 domain-containing protein [Acidobacteriaceae bacterium]|jgi:hypothetical protein
MVTGDKAGMAMKAMAWLLVTGLMGSAARAQVAPAPSGMDQNAAAAQVRMQAEQAKMVAQQSAMRQAQASMTAQQSLVQQVQATMTAQQSLMTAKLATLEPKLAVEQSLMMARLATLEPKLAVEQSLMLARLEPLELRGLGVEMQTGGGVTRVGQVKDDLFAGTEKFEKGASEVSDVNLDPSMMGMIHGGGPAGLAKKMRFMVVRSYEYPKEGMYNPDDVEVYRKKLEDGTWSCSIHVKDKDGTTDICSRSTPDHEGSEMVIIAAERRELTFIHMSGDMSLDDLEKVNAGQGRKSLPTPPTPPVAPAPAPGH